MALVACSLTPGRVWRGALSVGEDTTDILSKTTASQAPANYPANMQREALLKFAEALGSRRSALMRDKCGDWRIEGNRDHNGRRRWPDQVSLLATPKEDRCQRSGLGCAMRARSFG